MTIVLCHDNTAQTLLLFIGTLSIAIIQGARLIVQSSGSLASIRNYVLIALYINKGSLKDLVQMRMQVSDKLRDLLLNPESSNVSIYSPVERAELLFCIFEHLCLGGAVNQFEVNLRSHGFCIAIYELAQPHKLYM